MKKIISRTEKIIRRLKKEGKSVEIKWNSTAFNNSMKKVIEESNRKQNASWNRANEVWLD